MDKNIPKYMYEEAESRTVSSHNNVNVHQKGMMSHLHNSILYRSKVKGRSVHANMKITLMYIKYDNDEKNIGSDQ